jgi:hypothetical protein
MRFIKSCIHKLILLACVVTVPSVIAQDERRLPPEANVALALGGGGFLSTTDMAGLTAGLLSVLMTKDGSLGVKKDKGEDSLVESGLFSRVETINSISGGSWFASKLIYSEQYRRMIEELAFAKAKGASIAELSEIFQKEDSIVKLANLAENTPSVQSS